MKISDSLLGEFDQETKTNRTVLERCPDEKFGWKPHLKSWDMSTLASHIAYLLSWGADILTKDAFDVAPEGADPYKEAALPSSKELLALFDKNAAIVRAALAAASDEHFRKDWSLLAGGKVLFTMPRIAALRSFVFNHTVHHRGQLTVYLRLNDIPVPCIYGPSADENMTF
ncbi:MAG TPA: DinB family protein [Bryobacteraceae bacterium]|nr:DinB family protein [Bryobacteraceae bacterium]